jgi:SapC
MMFSKKDVAMATQVQPQPGLPLFYNALVPVNRDEHLNFAVKERDLHPFATVSNAVPITVDEFAMAQRHYPIVFAPGEQGGAPLALLGLEESENLFCDKTGKWREGCYIPAYVRRYPFLLARLTAETQDLSLCFDNTSDIVGPAETGSFFDGDQPSETTKQILTFCEQFEIAVQRTKAFVEELKELGLLMDAEATIQEGDRPMVFRGFRMIDEKKVQELRGDQARKLVKSGGLGLIYAHFFSLGTLRELFALKQTAA